MRLKIHLLLFMVAIAASPAPANAQASAMQNRVNLEDVTIQGEANKNQNLFQNRSKFDLDERLQIRRDFRNEINESIPAAFDQLSKTPAAATAKK